MKPDEAIQPDAHLRTALRHAPDADVAAPADISAQIIAAAHRSARERAALPTHASAGSGRWWLQPWGASGALATLLMAGVIGLMWRGEAPGPAREDAVPQVAQAPVPAPTPSTTPAPAIADAQATPPAHESSTPPAATKPRVIATAPAVTPPTKAAVQPMAPEPSETVASARDAAAGVVGAPPIPVAPVAPAAPAAPAAPPPLPAAGANLRATQRAAQEQSAAAPPTAPAPTAAARLRAPAAPSTAPQPPWRTAPLPGDQFSWLPADRLQPPDAAWLARLADLSAGRWQPQSATPTTAEVAQLHWQRGGATVARFGFDRSSVWWCSPLVACESARLDAATVRDLLAALAR